MAYKMATGMGTRLENVLPNTDPINKNNTNPSNTTVIERKSVPGEKDGVKGNFISTTTRTTYSGTRGSNNKNRLTYKEFAKQGGNVEAAKKWNAANPRTPNRHEDNTTTEFIGRVNSNLKPKGIVPQKEIPAKMMPTPTPKVTVTPPPRPAWETGKPPKKRTRGGGGREFRFGGGRSSRVGNRTFGQKLRDIFTGCKSC